MNHEQYMKEALYEAEKAYKLGEVPVGAVIVYKNRIISRGHNMRETLNDPTAHAEMIAYKKVGEIFETWNLSECTLYVTVEPCAMCAGAAIQARISTVVYGASEPKGGSFGSTINLTKIEGFNHYPEIIKGVLEKECSEIMVRFFKMKREQQIKIKRVTNTEMLEQALLVRKKVFVIEQEVDETLEYDAYDDLETTKAIHLVALKNNEVVGTLRLIPKGKELKVGRVAVLKEMRKMDIGKKLMYTARVYAENNGYNALILDAQLQAIPFYNKQGYTEFGDIFLDAGIEHKKMRCEI